MTQRTLDIPPARSGPIQDLAGAEAPRRPRAVTWRSVLLGVALVTFLSAYTPFNHVLRGAAIEGTYMPSMGFIALALMVLINAAVTRFAPHRRLAAGEYAVVMAMILSAAGVVHIGLFRQLPGNIANVWVVAQENLEWKRLLQQMDLPDWMFPTTSGQSVDERASDPVIQYYHGRTPLDDRSLASQFTSVPWGAWLRPALSWGAFCMCLWGASLCAVMILRRQWVENERLPFPIAQVYLSLMEPPEPGRMFSRLFRERSLWIAFFAVFTLRLLEGLNIYWPRYFPAIKPGYDFTSLFSEQPWSYVTWGLKEQESISYTLIAVCLFITTKLSFSLWFFFLASQAVRMYVGHTYQREISGNMEIDQTLGAFLAYGLATAWVARQHLGTVVQQMLRGARAGEPRGRYVPYVVVGWALVAFVGGMTAWLWMAGATTGGAIFIAVFLLFGLTGLARLVAETGLVFVVFTLSVNRWFIYALQDLPGRLSIRSSTETYFYSNLMGGVYLQDLGHSFAPHAATSLRIADSSGYEGESDWRRAWPLLACIALALVLAYVVAGAGNLFVEYNNSVTWDTRQEFPNDWGAVGMSRWHVLNPSIDYLPPRTGPQEPHSRLGHFTFGAIVTAVCSAMRLRYDWWPFHPVGFILVYGWGINRMWASIFLGWLLKVLVVRFGGARLLRNIRPFFLGLILGEAAGGLFWTAVSIVRLSLGMDFQRV